MSDQFKVLYWNIDQANREEKFEETKWDNRSSEIKKIILEEDPDIVCLVELRNLKTSKQTVGDFLCSFPKEYDHLYRKYCHYNDAFYMGILFKNTKLFNLDTRVKCLLDVPSNDKLVIATDFQSKETGKKFTVCLTHFPLGEEDKWKCVNGTMEFLESQKYPAFMCGDYNFFDDREGKEQRDEMLKKFNDVAYPLCNPNGKQLSGTFIGFAHDEFKKDEESMSRLDHVFVKKDTSLKFTGAVTPQLDLYCLDNSKYNDNMYPSDHMAVQFDVSL